MLLSLIILANKNIIPLIIAKTAALDTNPPTRKSLIRLITCYLVRESIYSSTESLYN